jgi:hypothetical protein
MAADLVESPNTLQTLEHDLESFFWVLLWIILTQVPCSWDITIRSKFINDTMRPNVYGQSGGQAKMTFLTSDTFRFEIPNNTTLSELLIALKHTVAARHHPQPSLPGKFWPNIAKDKKVKTQTANGEEETKTQMELQLEWALTEYHEGLKYLEDHSTMLRQFKEALDDEWPSNDKAVFQGTMAAKSTIQLSNSSSKRSRDVAQRNGTSLLPPSSSKRRA